jgi:hypothetical protein
MHSGKPVKSSRKTQGKKSVLLSTLIGRRLPRHEGSSAQPALIPDFTPIFAQYFSPLKIASLPLVEHYFYPVSTGPINTPIK